MINTGNPDNRKESGGTTVNTKRIGSESITTPVNPDNLDVSGGSSNRNVLTRDSLVYPPMEPNY